MLVKVKLASQERMESCVGQVLLCKFIDMHDRFSRCIQILETKDHICKTEVLQKKIQFPKCPFVETPFNWLLSVFSATLKSVSQYALI